MTRNDATPARCVAAAGSDSVLLGSVNASENRQHSPQAQAVSQREQRLFDQIYDFAERAETNAIGLKKAARRKSGAGTAIYLKNLGLTVVSATATNKELGAVDAEDGP